MKEHNCIVILGPTASGKTQMACQLANALNGEVISADSRQVYRGLTIGTGKDLDEYNVNGRQIPYHLIDIIDPAEQFYLHHYVAALNIAFEKISRAGKMPIICGGTGLYLDVLRKDFSYTQVPEDNALRDKLAVFTTQQLQNLLRGYPAGFTAHVDLNSRKRMIRGIEVAEHFSLHGKPVASEKPPYMPFYLGIVTDIETRRRRVAERLRQRLDAGLIDEVYTLLSQGISPARLEFFGLEYKFVLQHIQGRFTKEELFNSLLTAILQFAKRQMTWFRKMEKEGVKIHWIKKDAELTEILALLDE